MVCVRPSRIHGLGLFASATIKRGTVIGVLEGEYVDDDGPHVLWVDDERGFHVRNDLRYINHDTTPNAAYFDDLTVVALRDIAPGEEITHDYEGEAEIDDEVFEAVESVEAATAEATKPAEAGVEAADEVRELAVVAGS